MRSYHDPQLAALGARSFMTLTGSISTPSSIYDFDSSECYVTSASAAAADGKHTEAFVILQI